MSNALKYDRQVDLNDSSSIGILSRWIAPKSRVLEFGPATGSMTRILSRQLDCDVVCVEIDPDAANIARPYCSKMIVGDLEVLDLGTVLEPRSFDIIVFADVLEHLRNPEGALRRVAPFLKEGGSILASIPNIGHSGVILDLMQGEFRYRKEGLLDETHLRFFTRRSVAELFSSAGFAIQHWERTALDPEFSEFHHSIARAPKPVRDFMTGLPDWNTYQFLVRAYPATSEQAKSLPVQGDFTAAVPPSELDVVQVFMDLGSGFHEDLSISRRLQIQEGLQTIRFDIEPTSVRRLRIDPFAGAVFFGLSKIEVRDVDGTVVWHWNESSGPLSEKATLISLHEMRISGASFFAADSLDPQIILYRPEEKEEMRVASLSIEIDSLPTRRLTTLADSFDRVLKELDAMSMRGVALEENWANAQVQLTKYDHELHLLYSSWSWRLSFPIRVVSALTRRLHDSIGRGGHFLKSKIRRLLAGSKSGQRILENRAHAPLDPVYEQWLEDNELGVADLSSMREASQHFFYQPLISIVLPVYEPTVSWLNEAIQSVRKQAYQRWELCVADDCSKNPEVRELLERHMREDSRIKVCFRTTNGHISEASNSALLLAGGDYIALLDHDDLLSPDALFEVVAELNKDPSIDMLYSNEDKVDSTGRRCQPTFKPQWSPDYFLSFMYIGHLSVYRRSLVNAVNGFRKGLEGSQDYDLALRFVERAENVRHIPKILYHWRMHEDSVASNIHAKPYAFRSGHRALSEALERRGERDISIENTRLPGIYRLRGKLAQKPAVCVVITSGEKSLLSGDVAAIVGRLHYREAEVVLGGLRVPAHAQFPKYLSFEGQKYSRREEVWQAALSTSKADFILFIDAHVRPVSHDWLEELVCQASRQGVAAVGPKIVDTREHAITHGGYSIKGSTVASNFHGLPEAHAGYAARMYCLSNVSALSSDCILFKREFLTDFAGLQFSYASTVARDVDLSLSLAKSTGGRIVLTSHAQVSLPVSSVPRLSELGEVTEDITQLEARHQLSRFADPFYPQGLDAKNLDFKLSLES